MDTSDTQIHLPYHHDGDGPSIEDVLYPLVKPLRGSQNLKYLINN